MFLKSVFQNKILINFSFFFCLILSLGLFLISFVLNENNFNIPLLGGKNADIRINIEGGKNQRVYADDIELKSAPLGSDFSEYKTYEINNSPVYNLKIEGKDIKSAIISVGHRLFLFKKENLADGLNFKGKYINHGNYITDKGILKSFQTYILSVFYNYGFFLFPLLFLCFSFLIYSFNKEKINPGFNFLKGKEIYLILVFAALLRLADLSPSFWTDETYSAYMAGNIDLPFLSAFTDPGNPPLFFILVKFCEIFCNKNEALLRLLPFIFSIMSVYFIYLFIKKYFDKKAAIISSFLFSVNIYGIISAQELRSYSLTVFLSLILGFFLFKTIENPDNKNFIIYGVLSSLAINTHYFLAFILLSNFIWGEILIKKGKLKFLYSNLIAFLTFLPYFLMTGLNKGLLDEGFNKLNTPDLNFYLNVFIKFAQGKITALIFILFFLYLIFKKKNIPLYFYSLFLIFSVFLFSYIFSFIKPVSQEYYFICLLPCFIILFGVIFSFPFKNKIFKTVLILIMFLSYFGLNNYIQRERARLLNFDNLISFYKFDSFDKDSALIIPHSKEMIKIAYNLNEDELIVLNLPQKADKIIEAIQNSKKDEVYLKLEHYVMREFFNKVKKDFNVSFIRTDKDVIIAKVQRKRD